MVNSLAAIQILHTREERQAMEEDEYIEYIKHRLCHEMADFILEESEDFITTNPYRRYSEKPEDCDMVYKLELAVLTPARYRELLRKEEKLKCLTEKG
jgi:hypothetical protein